MQRPMQSGNEIYWWRRVSGSIDFPYRGKIVKIGPSLITVRVEDVATEEHVVRHVTRARVQLVGEYCAKIDKQGPSFLDPMKAWGKFTRYIDVDVDLRAKKQVDLFENGHMLRYDRTHWIDSYGMLGDARISRNQLAGPWGKPERRPLIRTLERQCFLPLSCY